METKSNSTNAESPSDHLSNEGSNQLNADSPVRKDLQAEKSDVMGDQPDVRNEEEKSPLDDAKQVEIEQKFMVYLTESEEFDDFNTIREEYGQIPSKVTFDELIIQLEYILSKKWEKLIKRKLSAVTVKDFEALLKVSIQKRIESAGHDVTKILRIKHAFYSELSNQVDEYAKKDQETRAREVTLILGMAQGTLLEGAAELQEEERKLLEKVLKVDDLSYLNEHEIFEKIVFKLSKKELGASKLPLDSIRRGKTLLKLSQVDSENGLMRSLNLYAIDLSTKKKEQDRAKSLMEIQDPIKYLDEIKVVMDHLDQSEDKEKKAAQIIQSSLEKRFKEDSAKRNSFLLSLLKKCEGQEQAQFPYRNKFVDLLDFQELLIKEEYEQVLTNFQEVEQLKRIDQDKKLEIFKMIEEKLCLDCKAGLDDLKTILGSAKETQVTLAIQTSKARLVEVEDSCDLSCLTEIQKIRGCITNYKIALKKAESAKEGTEEAKQAAEDKEKSSKTFVKKSLEILRENVGKQFKLDFGEELNLNKPVECEVLEEVKNKLQSKSPSKVFLDHYLAYVEFKVNLTEKKDQELSIDKEAMEIALVKIVQGLKGLKPTKSNQLLQDLVSQTFRILDEGFINEVLERVLDIEESVGKKDRDINAIKEQIVSSYERKLTGLSSLMKQGRVGFLQSIFENLQIEQDKSSFAEQEKYYKELQSKLEEMKLPEDIEDYIAGENNKAVLLDKAKEENKSIQEYVEETKKRIIDDIKNKTKEGDQYLNGTQNCEEFLRGCVDLSSLIGELFFESSESQEEMDRFRSLVMELATHYEREAKKDKESIRLLELVDSLNDFLILKCYRKYNFFKHIDKEEDEERRPVLDFEFLIYGIEADLARRFEAIDRLNELSQPQFFYRSDVVKSIIDHLSRILEQVEQKSLKTLDEELTKIAKLSLTEEGLKKKLQEISKNFGGSANEKLVIQTTIRCLVEDKVELESLKKEVLSFSGVDLNLIPNSLRQWVQGYIVEEYGILTNKQLQEIEAKGECKYFGKLKSMKKHIFIMENDNLKIQLCALFSKALQNIQEKNVVDQLNKEILQLLPEIYAGISSFKEILQVLISSGHSGERDFRSDVNQVISILPLMRLEETSIILIKGLLAKLLERLSAAQKDNLDFLFFAQQLTKYCFKNTNTKENGQVLKRIYQKLKELANMIPSVRFDQERGSQIKDWVNLCKSFLNFDQDSRKEALINFISRHKNYLLIAKEIQYSKVLDETQVKEVLLNHPVNVWEDELENAYIRSTSLKLLKDELEGFEKSSQGQDTSFFKKLKHFVETTDFDEAARKDLLTLIDLKPENILKKAGASQEAQQVNLIVKLKENLLVSKERIGDVSNWIQWLGMIEGLKQTKRVLGLVETIEILELSQVFDMKLWSYILSKDSYKEIMLAILGCLMLKMDRDETMIFEVEEIIEKIDAYTREKWKLYVRLLVKKLVLDCNKGLRYERSEMVQLSKIISMSLSLRLYEREDLLIDLAQLKLLKWSRTLKSERIKYELGIEDEQVIKDLLYLERAKGEKLTNKLIDKLKAVYIEGEQLKNLLSNFRRNIWELNDKVVDSLDVDESSKWAEIIEENDKKTRGKELKAKQLVSQMKRLEAEGEINCGVRDLLDRAKGQSPLEVALKKVDTAFKSEPKFFRSIESQILDSGEEKMGQWEMKVGKEKKTIGEALINGVKAIAAQLMNGGTIESQIQNFSEEDIKQWAEKYMKIDKEKKTAGGIVNDGVIELVAVIARAAQLTSGGTIKPRETQNIALLLFIDSMINNLHGRLANISTGEGKSLITISTAIANILIKGGGTVDILTSSEVLAERDAQESSRMFGMFNIKVSNNCDLEADSDESVRKKRYEENDVIYGELSHFERDILLTKYYNKEIRASVATCLIIDEVDSMWVDNIANTLYISHQITDLRYLKDCFVFIWQAVNEPGTTKKTKENMNSVHTYVKMMIDEGHINYPHHLQKFIERRLPVWIENAYVAKDQIGESNQYTVLKRGKKIGEIVINDLQTGVEQLNSQWSEGLQQFIQLKHTNRLTEESLKAIYMSNYIFFKEYGGEIYGMTGTLGTVVERELLASSYKVDFFELPRFKRELNIREEDKFLKKRSKWMAEIEKEVDSMISCSRAVLIICQNKKDVDDILKTLLVKKTGGQIFEYKGKIDGFRKVLNTLDQTEGLEVGELKCKDIVVATNVAGRGTDFALENKLKENGGLHVILSYLPDNIRVEMQAFGRSGRKGEEGSGRMIAYSLVDTKDAHDLASLRDKREEERLQEIRVKTLKSVVLERELFLEYTQLEERVQAHFKERDARFRSLQQKSLHNKWAFWLDEVADQVENIYQTGETGRKQIFESYQIFAEKIITNLGRERNGIEGLIDEPGELIKLAAYNIQSGNFKLAQDNCDQIIQGYGSRYSGFAYYYKATAIFQPLQDSDYAELLDSIRKKCKGHIITYNEKKEGVELLKKAIVLFEEEIQRISMRSQILAKIKQDNIHSGIGSDADYFTRSNVNECAVIQVHLNAAKHSLSQELDVLEMLPSVKPTCLTEEECSKVLKGVLEEVKDAIKPERLSQRVKVRFHFDNNPNTEKILKSEISAQGGESRERVKENEDEEAYIILDSLSKKQEEDLKANSIQYTREIYIKDRIHSNYVLVKYPARFEYAKQRMLTAFKRAEGKGLEARKGALDQTGYLTRENVWSKLEKKIGFEEVKRLAFKKEKLSILKESSEMSEEFKKKLLDSFKVDDQDQEYKNNLSYEDFEALFSKKKKSQALNTRDELIKKQVLEIQSKFKFQDDKRKSIELAIKKIQIHQSITNKDLEKLDFSDFLALKKNQQKIIQMLQKEDKTVTIDDYVKFVGEDEKDLAFAILRKYLITKGFALDLITEFNIKDSLSGYEVSEMSEFDNAIEDLLRAGVFDQNDISIEPLSDLFEHLKDLKVIKGKVLDYKLIRAPESIYEKAKSDLSGYFAKDEKPLEILKKKIKQAAKGLLKKTIDEKDKNTIVSDKEVDDEYESLIKKLKWVAAGAAVLTSISTPFILGVIPALLAHNKFRENQKESTIEGDLDKLVTQENSSLLLDKFEKSKLFVKAYLKEKLIQEKKDKEKEQLPDIIVNTILNTLGPLKLYEMVTVECKKIEDYFGGTDMPKEAFEYSQLDKGLVLSFMEYRSPWCWKSFAVAMLGTLQIAAGALIMAYGSGILGPLAYHIGTGLISEGASDIMYAIQNVGNVTGKSYWDHKKWSLLITVGTVGVGAYLSNGASTAKMAMDVAKEQASRIILKQAAKKGTRSTGMAIFKKILGEVGKASLNAVQAMAVNELSSLFAATLFEEFKETIISMIQKDSAYINNKSILSKNIRELQEKVIYCKATVKEIVEEKLSEAEAELAESISNQIVSLIGKIGGPLSTQIGEAAENVQYSGLVEVDGTLQNSKQQKYAQIAKIISYVVKGISYLKAAYDLVTLVGEIVSRFTKKIGYYTEILEKSPNKTKMQEMKQGSERESEEKECLMLVDESIAHNIRNQVESSLINPIFDKLVDHILNPIHKKIEKSLFEDFAQLKKRALAYGEYNSRYEENRKEIGREMELIKDFLTDELKSFKFESPILEVDLENVVSGTLTVQIDSELLHLNLSVSEDRELIRDRIGAIGMRVLPGDPPRLSRPNFTNYLQAWTPGKQVNEFDLQVMAYGLGRPICVEINGHFKTFGPPDGEPLYMQHQNDNTSNKGHYIPLIKQENSLVPISDLPNVQNACGIEALLYAVNREKFLNSGKSHQDAHSEARSCLMDPNVRDDYIKNLIKSAKGSSCLKDAFLLRDHEIGIVGGAKVRKSPERNRRGGYLEKSHKRVHKFHSDSVKESIICHVQLRIDKTAELAEELVVFMTKDGDDNKALAAKVICEAGALYQNSKSSGLPELVKGDKESHTIAKTESHLNDAKMSDLKNLDYAHFIGCHIDIPCESDASAAYKIWFNNFNARLGDGCYMPKGYNIGPDRILDKAQIKFFQDLIKDIKTQDKKVIKDKDFLPKRIREFAGKINFLTKTRRTYRIYQESQRALEVKMKELEKKPGKSVKKVTHKYAKRK